jgi:phospholipase/carboxylesterase
MTAPLDAIVHGPDTPSGTVIWMHGLGASGDDFVPVLPLLERPDLRFVLPHAPKRPVTINGGYPMRAWYDITQMEPGPDREPEADVRDTAAAIDRLIQAERDRGVPAARILLVGFSQGGAMALHCALRWPERLAGVVALSTYLVLPDTLPAERAPASDGMPAFFAHGIGDPTVSWDRGRDAYETLADDLQAEWLDYPMEHELCIEEIHDLRAFLGRALPPA